MAGKARQHLGTEILTNRLNLLLTASVRDAGSWPPVLVRNLSGTEMAADICHKSRDSLFGVLGCWITRKQELGTVHQSSVSTCHHQLIVLLNLVIRNFWSSSRWQGLSRCRVHGRSQNLPLWSFYLVEGEGITPCCLPAD